MFRPVPIGITLFAVVIAIACVINVVRRRNLLSFALLVGAVGPALSAVAYWIAAKSWPSELSISTGRVLQARAEAMTALGTAAALFDVVFAVSFLVLILTVPQPSSTSPRTSAGPA